MAEFGTPASRRIIDIYDRFYTGMAESKILELAKSINSFSDLLTENFGFQNNFNISIQDYAIRNNVENYYLDIIRYKEYHFNPSKKNGELEDVSCYSEEWTQEIHDNKILSREKIAALTLKWLKLSPLVHIFPVQGYRPTQPEQDILAASNAMFSLAHCFELMQFDPDSVPENIYDELLYNLIYRAYDESHFYLIFSQIVSGSTK